ncbi:MAG: NAD-dependent epimerase/dehydratase family protein [Victivallales bacterium]|nr:NAD-dependent epimerase/dehydratase family protein [Victivallales bacterium]
MIRIGITGQAGFIGSHLANYFRIQDDIELTPFIRDYFEDTSILKNFVAKCDIIIHLAAMSRHPDGKILYENNINLDKKLITALEKQNSRTHIIFASTTHEMREGDYYASKRDGQKLFQTWGGKFTTMLMPNTFGPYGKPYFNSVVSTFCHKVAHNEEAEIMVDAPVELIYINELCHEFHKVIKGEIKQNSYIPSSTATKKVSEILNLLLNFRELYVEQRIIPEFKDNFEINLFNTFQTYL